MKVPLLAACLLAAWPAAAQTVRSLDQVPSVLRTPEAKRSFAEQMTGKQPPDQFGRQLPPGLSAPQVTGLLVPGNTAPLNIVGAKPWPAHPDFFVAIVCTGGDVPKGANDIACTQFGPDTTPALRVTVGVIEAPANAAPRLVAKPLTVEGAVDWGKTDLPAAPDEADDAPGGTIRPSGYAGLDLAPYRIAPTEPAFGLRGTWSNGYSGGFGQYEALYLFAILDGAVKQVLAVPMSALKNIAGDFHKDGTRSHEITSGANVLVVSEHVTAGHFDLVLRNRNGRASRIYRWSEKDASYQPAQ